MKVENWLMLTLAVLVLWGIWAFLPKLSTQYISSPVSLILFEVLGGVSALLMIFALFGKPVEFEPRGFLFAFLAGVCAIWGAYLFLEVISKHEVSRIVMITGLYPAFAVILGILLLHESLSVQKLIGIGLAFISILILAGE